MSRKKKTMVVAVIVLLTAVCLKNIKIQSVDQFYSETVSNGTDTDISVVISISCDTVLDNYDQLDEALKSEKYIPQDGVILQETEYEVSPGASVFDVLSKAVQDKKILMEYQGKPGDSVYIQRIDYLGEFSCGPMSGWMYLINDESPDVGCDLYQVEDGDVIRWVYTCELGKDLEDKPEEE